MIRKRAGDAKTRLTASPQELAAASSIILSVVTASAAGDAAAQIAQFLTPGHIYADLNSVSPALKQHIAGVVNGSGAKFVEAAVMAPVPPYAHRVPMLLGGNGAREFANTLVPLGMRLEVISETVVKAAAVKMCRSIVVKGLEAILFECVMGASKYEAED